MFGTWELVLGASGNAGLGGCMEPFERFTLVILFLLFVIYTVASLLVALDAAFFSGGFIRATAEYYFGALYSNPSGKWIMFSTALVSALIAMGLYFYDAKERHLLKSITMDGKLGTVSISHSAIEDYVEKVGIRLKDVKDIKAKVKCKRDGIYVFCKIAISAGSSIPMLADRIGEEIKNAAEAIFGIFGIKEVKIFVDKIITEHKEDDVQPGRRYY
jgi:uncharacterized alkaline shock family protein YloU